MIEILGMFEPWAIIAVVAVIGLIVALVVIGAGGDGEED